MCLHTLAGTTVHHCQCAVELMCSGVVNYHIGIYWMCLNMWLLIWCHSLWQLLYLLRYMCMDQLFKLIGSSMCCSLDSCRCLSVEGFARAFSWDLCMASWPLHVQRLTVSDSHMFAYIKAHFAVQIPCQLLCLSACWCHLSDEMMKLKDGKVERSESRQAALRSKAWPRHWGKDAGLWPRLTDIGMFDTWDILRFCAPHISTFLRHSCLAKLMSWSVCLPCLLSPRSWFLTVVGTYCEIWYVNISNIIYIYIAKS